MVTPGRICCARICLAIGLLPCALVAAGCGDASVPVLNDTGGRIEVSACLDDTIAVGPGDTFHAVGVPQDNNELLCLLIPPSGSQRCISIPSKPKSDTYLLSRARRVVMSRCP
jgi:hypothetical protein